MTSPIMPSQYRSPLGALGLVPFEVRQLIYSHLLDTRPHEARFLRNYQPVTSRSRRAQMRKAHIRKYVYRLDTRILYTSRMLYKETSAFLYNHNPIVRVRMPNIEIRYKDGIQSREVPGPIHSPMLHCFGPFEDRQNIASQCRRHSMDITAQHACRNRKHVTIFVTATQLTHVVFWLSSVGLVNETSKSILKMQIQLHHGHHANKLITLWTQLIYFQPIIWDVPLEARGCAEAVKHAIQTSTTTENRSEMYEDYIKMIHLHLSPFLFLTKADYETRAENLHEVFEYALGRLSVVRGPLCSRRNLNDLATLRYICSFGRRTCERASAKAGMERHVANGGVEPGY